MSNFHNNSFLQTALDCFFIRFWVQILHT